MSNHMPFQTFVMCVSFAHLLNNSQLAAGKLFVAASDDSTSIWHISKSKGQSILLPMQNHQMRGRRQTQC